MFEARPTKCKRCGCEDVAWNQNRNGKWYLVEGGYCHPDLQGGFLLFSKTKYHNCEEYKKQMDKIRAEIECGMIKNGK